MKNYTVIKSFTDLQDKRHLYHAGDVFPRDGLQVTQKRLDELSGANNRQHKPLIEETKLVAPNKLEESAQKELSKGRSRRKK